MAKWKEHRLVGLLLLKGKYATASLVATSVEYGLYSLFVYVGQLEKTKAHVSSFALAMVTNFLLQRFFVFQLNRPVWRVFLMAVAISLGGLTLSTLLFSGLMKIDFFFRNHYLAKMLATCTIFLYNFYLKRFAFEKKFL